MPRATNRVTENKPNRVPVSGIRDILTVYGKDDRFKYRFVDDVDEKGMRIMRFTRGGWTFTEGGEHSDIVVGEECVYKTRDGSSIIRFPSGQGRFSYLMQIPREIWDSDQKAKQDEIDEVEATITRPIAMQSAINAEASGSGQYGKVTINRD